MILHTAGLLTLLWALAVLVDAKWRDDRAALERIGRALFFVIIGVALLSFSAHAETIRVPAVDARLRLLVQQSVGEQWGVDGSPALLAAQLHQESHWDANAESGVGAEGLAQIMPATGRWLAAAFPAVGAYDPWDPAWSINAAAVYDHWLYVRNPGATPCAHWAFTFSAYNGGETLLHREQALAADYGRNPLLWFGNTGEYRARSMPAWRQNRGYVWVILREIEPAYVAAGWSGEVVCR